MMERKKWTGNEAGNAAVDMHWQEAVAAHVGTLLHGHAPQQQGLVLVELVAKWLAGHEPHVRDAVFDLWITTVRAMVPLVHEELFGDGNPWEGDT